MFKLSWIRLTLFLACLFVIVIAITQGRPSGKRNRRSTSLPHPVILVPGDGGSQLEAILDKPQVVHYFCDKKTTNYFSLWLNLELLVPMVIDCWVDNMRLIYDNHTRTTSSPPGVHVRVAGFGNSTSVEFIDPSQIGISSYFSAIVKHLVSVGFERDVSIRGAPYDFRKSPLELSDYFRDLKKLVEETYELNNKSSVVFVCHSMGCPMSLYLFNHMTKSWKDKYVRALVSLAGPWGGAVKALKAFASGDNLGAIVIPSLTVRADQRSFPSLSFLLPTDRFWSQDEVLVASPERNYTVRNYRDFFQDIGFETGYEMWLDTRNITYELTPPEVEVHCLHGIKVDTIEKVTYGNKFPNTQPSIVYGDGDGTVNARSLLGCLRWSGKQQQQVFNVQYPNTDHMGVLSNPEVLYHIGNLTLGTLSKL